MFVDTLKRLLEAFVAEVGSTAEWASLPVGAPRAYLVRTAFDCCLSGQGWGSFKHVSQLNPAYIEKMSFLLEMAADSTAGT